MDANRLLSLLPDHTLEELALETNVDKFAKKLYGPLVFKLLIHSILSFKDNSLRMMESAYESVAFRLINAKISSQTIRFSSISERLSIIEPAYFEKLYQKCIENYGAMLSPQKVKFIRFDSTIVALSGKLLKIGYQIKGSGSAHLKQLKFTIGFSNLPVSVHFFTEQVYTSENVALKEAVFSIDPAKTDVIRIFDKGINARKTYDELTENQIPFISRLNTQTKIQEVVGNELTHHIQTPTLEIYSDRSVYLFRSHGPKSIHPVRFIEAVQVANGEKIAFVTNINSKDLSAADITILYKYRWDIEVFFKFLKQELNFDHLINRSENGIKVMLYCTMIAAILLLAYKELNGIKGYKIMKHIFINDLEKSLMKDIIELCGGDPNRIETIFKPPE